MVLKDVHGGHWGFNMMDPGAISNGYKEAEIAHSINNLMVKYTGVPDTSDYLGKTVLENLENIVDNMNKRPGDYHISNHLNAYNGIASGVEVWYLEGDEESRQMAAKVSAVIAKTTGLYDRGAKATTGLYVIRNSIGRTLLIEWGFIDNHDDLRKLLPNMEKAVQEVVKLFGYSGNLPKPGEPNTQIKKVGKIMLLFRSPNDPKVYFLLGNKYAHVQSESDLSKIKELMTKYGYDTTVCTDETQISYIKKASFSE